MQPAGNTQFDARLLVAEDNPINLDIAARILETMGCRVVTADNGAMAALLLTQEKFDLVLMDCEMPDLDGLEATKLARTIEVLLAPRKRVPIVALTSHALDDVRQKCLAAGMDDLLAKPFSKQQMRETLRRWIGDLERAPADADATGAPKESVSDLPPPADEDPVIDRKVMNAVLDANGSAGHAFLARLYERFAELAPRHMASLWEKYNAKLPDELWRIAHNLKSGASALGARQLSRSCAEIEKEAREHGLETLQPKLVRLETDLAVAMESLKNLIGELNGRTGEV